ncbi:unnamed protein product [Ilex paraguariensis]|uniref:Seipin n=1 Tax=Ilex paraguariensis TaxID=185542 RepID=A0ABC8SRP5_9AQUA
MMEEEEKVEDFFPIPNPSAWFMKFVSLQVEILYNSLVPLTSPIFSLLYLASESCRRTEKAKERFESIVHGCSLFLRKIGLGFLGAVYVCIVLTMLMFLAVILGVGLVNLWVEEPVFMRESLHFDYTDIHPEAVFPLRSDDGGFGGFIKRKKMGVPVGHTFFVRLVLLMPESDFNLEIGVFQVTAELISTNGVVVAKSGQPSMLHFRSFPIRLMRTLLMSIPVLLGIAAETQKISIPIVKHKEGCPRTEAIRITLIPRAGTSSPPQLYEAEVILNSQLPWRKEFVRCWKWTFYVWTSLYVYLFLLIVLVSCFRPLLFLAITGTTATTRRFREKDLTVVTAKGSRERAKIEREVSETLRRWQQHRGKRKAMLLHGFLPETVGLSASSISVTREDTSTSVEEDAGDLESVSWGG